MKVFLGLAALLVVLSPGRAEETKRGGMDARSLAPFLDAGTVAQRLRNRSADNVTGILGRVMEIDMQIAFGVQRDVDEAVARQLFKHMVEKADPGRDVARACPVEVDASLAPRFLGVAFDRPEAHGSSPDTVLAYHRPRSRHRRLLRALF